MKAGEILQAAMLRIEPDALLLKVPDGTEVRVVPDLKQIFVPGKQVAVFISHRDREGRFWGSMETPLLALGEVAFLEVKSMSREGAFFDWGLEKPLFCPAGLIIGVVRPGMLAAVRLIEDPRSNGLIATMQWKSGVRAAGEDYAKGREVEVLVMESHELGFLVLADQWYQGIVYANQVFQPLRPGQHLQGWVNQLRPDGKLDILLRKPGYREVPDAARELLQKIQQAGGRLELGDKSPADEVYRQLGISKKVFKQALGNLYKAGKVGMLGQRCWLLDEADE